MESGVKASYQCIQFHRKQTLFVELRLQKNGDRRPPFQGVARNQRFLAVGLEAFTAVEAAALKLASATSEACLTAF